MQRGAAPADCCDTALSCSPTLLPTFNTWTTFTPDYLTPFPCVAPPHTVTGWTALLPPFPPASYLHPTARLPAKPDTTTMARPPFYRPPAPAATYTSSPACLCMPSCSRVRVNALTRDAFIPVCVPLLTLRILTPAFATQAPGAYYHAIRVARSGEFASWIVLVDRFVGWDVCG